MYINYIYSAQSRNLHNIEIALHILMNWELSIQALSQQQRAVQCGLLVYTKSLDNAAIYSATATAEKCFGFTSQRVCTLCRFFNSAIVKPAGSCDWSVPTTRSRSQNVQSLQTQNIQSSRMQKFAQY